MEEVHVEQVPFDATLLCDTQLSVNVTISEDKTHSFYNQRNINGSGGENELVE